MTDTCDLSQAEVGDVIKSKCGGSHIIDCVDSEDVRSGSLVWDRSDKSSSHEDVQLDPIALEKQPKPRTVEVDCWMNVSTEGNCVVWMSRDIAEKFSNSDRLACIHIKQTVKEGEGL